MSSLYELTGVSHEYQQKKVLHSVACVIPEGELVVIVGPNGAGKSTLLRLLAGVERPTEGQVFFNGSPLSELGCRLRARKIAYIPQQFEDVPFSVQETVALGRTAWQSIWGIGGSGDDGIVTEAMELTDVMHLVDSPVFSLSGGERQRVHIARALAQQSQVLLLDEPTSALDFAHQIHVMEMLSRLRRERGMSVLMVSHDLNLASMYATRVLLLAEGSLFAIGDPEELFTESMLEHVYGCPVWVEASPESGRPRIFPKPWTRVWEE